METQNTEDEALTADRKEMITIERFFKGAVAQLLDKGVPPVMIAFGLQEALFDVAVATKRESPRGSELLNMVGGNVAEMAARFARIERETDEAMCDKLEKIACRHETAGEA